LFLTKNIGESTANSTFSLRPILSKIQHI